MLQQLSRELDTLHSAAKDARDAATNEEAKPENKYDTRGLEASYLAGAQAARAVELQVSIDHLKRLEFKSYDSTTRIGSTALVKILVDDMDTKYLFLVPMKGGIKVTIDKIEVNTLSLDSPLGSELVQKNEGDTFTFTIGGKSKNYEIIQVT